MPVFLPSSKAELCMFCSLLYAFYTMATLEYSNYHCHFLSLEHDREQQVVQE